MKISPYLHFNGNCEQAIALYEKALGVKAEALRYSDAPPSEGYDPPPGTENLIMHACLERDGDRIMSLCDMPPDEGASFGNAMAVFVEMEGADAVKAAFNVLKEGGKVEMEPQKTFWSECFASLEDKFGVGWMLTVEE